MCYINLAMFYSNDAFKEANYIMKYKYSSKAPKMLDAYKQAILSVLKYTDHPGTTTRSCVVTTILKSRGVIDRGSSEWRRFICGTTTYQIKDWREDDTVGKINFVRVLLRGGRRINMNKTDQEDRERKDTDFVSVGSICDAYARKMFLKEKTAVHRKFQEVKERKKDKKRKRSWKICKQIKPKQKKITDYARYCQGKRDQSTVARSKRYTRVRRNLLDLFQGLYARHTSVKGGDVCVVIECEGRRGIKRTVVCTQAHMLQHNLAQAACTQENRRKRVTIQLRRRIQEIVNVNTRQMSPLQGPTTDEAGGGRTTKTRYFLLIQLYIEETT